MPNTLQILVTVKGKTSVKHVKVVSVDIIEIIKKFRPTGVAADAYGLVIQVKTYDDALLLAEYLEMRNQRLFGPCI